MPSVRGALAPCWVVLATLGTACSSHVELELFFTDELVEAPVRTVDVVTVADSDCDTLQAAPHNSATSLAPLQTVRYPIRPEENLFEGIPENVPVTIDVVARDRGGLELARACTTVTLANVEQKISVQLRALPLCTIEPSRLDVMLVLDTSAGAAVADPEAARFVGLIDNLLEPNGLGNVARWGIVTFGHDDGAFERLPATEDPELVRESLATLRGVTAGPTRLFDGVTKGGELLRARAVCGQRPVLFVITGFADGGSRRSFLDAGISIYAAVGDAQDDIYTYGIGMTPAGFDALTNVIPDGLGVAKGAQTSMQITQSFLDARLVLNNLVR